MNRSSVTTGLLIGVLASLAFGTSGALAKPLMEAGWSPAATVTVRAGLAGILLLPFALRALHGKWDVVWRARWRILGMALIGVAGTQLVYFASLQRIPVSSALLIEYLAPLLLVAWVAIATRRLPAPIVLVGAVVAVGGLLLIIGPVGGGDALGYVLAGVAAVGCALYYVIAARPAQGLPPVALAAFGLLLGSLALGLVGATGLVPFDAVLGDVPLGGVRVPWWAPLLLLAATTAVGYATSIAASQLLGSRLMSFVGMLEVVFASVFAWISLGEALGPLQFLGGALILVGIACVRAEKQAAVPVEAVPIVESEPEPTRG
jgi:drug/metabolite transporter (DMT)-like permease